MYDISKEFDFCYGHRVHNQQLIDGFAEDTCLACRHLHGHQGKVKLTLTAEKLKSGMVSDFKHTGVYRRFIDDHLDHKFIMDINDPAFGLMFPQLNKSDLIPIAPNFTSNKKMITINSAKYLTPELNMNMNPVMVELYEGMVFVNFVPTSENLSKWLFDIATEMLSHIDVKVKSVTFNETPKSQAEYSVN